MHQDFPDASMAQASHDVQFDTSPHSQIKTLRLTHTQLHSSLQQRSFAAPFDSAQHAQKRSYASPATDWRLRRLRHGSNAAAETPQKTTLML
eukprot:3052484-Amphidinium_carterae.1